MNSKERINAAIALEQPDRVPVCPLLDHFAATYTGITNAEFMADGNKRINAVLKTMKDLGPWDMTFIGDTANPTMLKFGLPMKLLMPGVDLPETEVHQLQESEYLSLEDYDFLQNAGIYEFMMRIIKRNNPELNNFQIVHQLIAYVLELRKHRKMVEKNGAELAAGFMHTLSFDFLSFGRSIVPMSGDIFRHPEKIKAAGKVWAKTMTRVAKIGAKIVGTPRVFIGMARSSSAMISSKHFEEFVMPEMEDTVNNWIDSGMTPLFHCDMDWTKHLPFFKRLPSKKCILMLDGTTDIFKAKEILNGHMCIMGDVPATLTVLGTKDQVLDYCKRLIQEVGKGGGFILSSGCSLPVNAKVENIKALVEAAHEWGRYNY